MYQLYRILTVLLKQTYYKDNNAHDYLSYDSTHPDHSKDNVPYNHAKFVIVLVSNEEKVEYRLNES